MIQVARGRDAWVSAAYLAGAAAVAFLPRFGLQWSGEPTVDVRLTLVAVLLLIGCHLFRISAPLTMACAGLLVLIAEAWVTGVTSIGTLAIGCDLIYTVVVRHRSARMSRLASAVAIVCLLLGFAGMLFASAIPGVVAGFSVLVLALGVTLWWGTSVRAPMGQAERERQRAEQIAAAARQRQAEIVRAERMQISRELHDAISGHLSAIALHSAAALGPSDEDAVQARLEQIRASSLAALTDMRTMIEVLRADDGGPGAQSAQGWPRYRSLIAAAEDAGARIQVSDDSDLSDDALGPIGSAAAFHALKEGLVNAAKHAGGQPVAVRISVVDRALRIEIGNPLGDSPSADVAVGYGLVGLAERLRVCGGSLDAGVDERDGHWRLAARIPLSRGTEAIDAQRADSR